MSCVVTKNLFSFPIQCLIKIFLISWFCSSREQTLTQSSSLEKGQEEGTKNIMSDTYVQPSNLQTGLSYIYHLLDPKSQLCEIHNDDSPARSKNPSHPLPQPTCPHWGAHMMGNWSASSEVRSWTRSSSCFLTATPLALQNSEAGEQQVVLRTAERIAARK